MPFSFDDVLTLKAIDTFDYPGQAGVALESVSSDWSKIGTGPTWYVYTNEEEVYTTSTSATKTIYRHSASDADNWIVRTGLRKYGNVSSSYCGPAARIQGSTYECYVVMHGASQSTSYVYYCDASGSLTLLGSFSDVHFSTVRDLFLRVSGSTIEAGHGDEIYVTTTHALLTQGGVGFMGVKNDYRVADFTAWRLGYFAAAGAPPDPCTLSFVSKTTTSITVRHAPPADQTNYYRTRIYAAIDGASPVEQTTSNTNEDVTITGLSAGTEYAVFGVSEDASNNRGLVSEVVLEYTDVDPGATSVGGIKAALKTRLLTVAGLDGATIHTRLRDPLGRTDADARSIWESAGKVNAWEIERERASAAWGAPHHGAELDDVYVVRGWYSFDDANDSEAAFAALVEGVQKALVGDRTIGGRVRDSSHAIRVYGWAQKAGRLCHYVEVEVTTRWTITAI